MANESNNGNGQYQCGGVKEKHRQKIVSAIMKK
jgi:hypothetical protein